MPIKRQYQVYASDVTLIDGEQKIYQTLTEAADIYIKTCDLIESLSGKMFNRRYSQRPVLPGIIRQDTYTIEGEGGMLVIAISLIHYLKEKEILK
jgi:hypothetical protein